MSYVKQTWQTGDVVTSAKLNHMEDGIAAGGGSGGGGVLVVTATATEEDGNTVQTLNNTWQEIHDAILSNGAVLRFSADGMESVYQFAEVSDFGDEFFVTVNNVMQFSAETASGYPVSRGDK